MSITLLDFIVIGVMAVSAVLAMVRGFTREVLSVASWAAAALATLYFFPQVRDWARATIKLEPKIIADIIAGGAIFLVTLVIVSLLTARLSDLILDSRIGPIDRALGFFYGGARGLLLVVIAFLFFSWLVPPRSQPEWVQHAQSRSVLEGAGEALVALLPEDPEATILNRLKGGRPSGGDADATDVPDAEPAKPAPAPAPPTQAQSGGYRPGDRQGMQRLMETNRAPATPAAR